MVHQELQCQRCVQFKKNLIKGKSKIATFYCQDDKCFWELQPDKTWKRLPTK